MSQAPSRMPAPVRQQQAVELSTVVAALDARTDQFMALLGSPEAVARFRTVALHAISSKPDLLRCDPISIIEAVREAASLDLEPTGVLGEAWLIPYRGNAKLRIGWQGHLKLIRRSGQVQAVDCQVVYENDDFRIAYHLTPPFEHTPALTSRGSYRGAYAWAKLPTGEYIFEWLPVEDATPIRKIAAADSLMWNDFYGEALRKSAVRRLQKRLPKSVTVERALAVEAAAEDLPPTEAPPARSAAVAALAARFSNDDQAPDEADTPADEQATSSPVDPPIPESAPPSEEAVVVVDASSPEGQKLLSERLYGQPRRTKAEQAERARAERITKAAKPAPPVERPEPASPGQVYEGQGDDQAYAAQYAAEEATRAVDQATGEITEPEEDEGELLAQLRGSVEAVQASKAEQAEEAPLCDSVSPYGSETVCVREAGHRGAHRSDNESWT